MGRVARVPPAHRHVSATPERFVCVRERSPLLNAHKSRTRLSQKRFQLVVDGGQLRRQHRDDLFARPLADGGGHVVQYVEPSRINATNPSEPEGRAPGRRTHPTTSSKVPAAAVRHCIGHGWSRSLRRPVSGIATARARCSAWPHRPGSRRRPPRPGAANPDHRVWTSWQ
jgi:hypothetical protein